MTGRRELVLKAFLNQCSPDKREALESLLPPREQRLLSELTTYSIEEPNQESDLLQKVHWSWFLPTLKSHPASEQKLFLASLDPKSAKGLSHELHVDLDKADLSQSGKDFLRGTLFSSLVGQANELLPLQCLPPSPLNSLLLLSKKELIDLIDFLSLYDLGAELRQIVETKILKKIYSFLTEEQKSFLKIAMNQKESFSVPRVGLDRWDGTEEAFHQLLHRRGLARLGAALSGQDPDLIWYLCHQLDIGRGSALFKLCEKEAVPELAGTVSKQIEECLATIRKTI